MWVAPLVAFLVASIITAREILTTRYPHTYFVLTPRKCWACYAYIFLYGVVAAAVVLALDYLKAKDLLVLEGLGLGTRLGEAVFVGVAIKALLHIRIFDTKAGASIGIDTFVRPVEEWLLKRLDIQELNSVRRFVKPRADKYDLAEVCRLIEVNVPPSLDEEESKALLRDADEIEEAVVLMERYVRKTGKETFDRVSLPRFTADSSPLSTMLLRSVIHRGTISV